MRKWLVVLALAINSFTGTSSLNGSQYGDNKEDISKLANALEWMNTRAIGYSNLYKEGVETDNIPNLFPVDTSGFKRISDHYGMRIHPIFRCKMMHHGIDISGDYRTPIYATANGIVEKAAYSGGYGKTVIIDHGNGVKTVYAHLRKYDVKKGQSVKKGDMIAELGNSGNSTGPHLHYEVRVNGKTIDPILMVCKVNNRNQDDILEQYQKVNKDGRLNYYADSGEFDQWIRESCKGNTGKSS